MASSLEERIEYLFANRGSCLKEMACIFAERREEWLTQEDIINLIGQKYHNSTICSNFKKLSLPIKELDNHSYINTEVFKNNGRGRPAIRGRLSEAASKKIFTLVTPVKERPSSYFVELNKIGRVEILPMPVGKPTGPTMWLSPEDVMTLRKQKIGDKRADRLLQDIVNNKDEHFAEDFIGFKNRRPGPIPFILHRIVPEGLRKFGSDENRKTLIAGMNLVDSRQDDVRVNALEERAKKGEQTAFDDLIQVLSSDASKYARQDSAHSLGSLHDMRAVEPLAKAMLNDEYSGVRLVAAIRLGEFGYSQEFTMALKDSDSHVRQEVATILAKIGDVRAVEPLREALKDPDIGVQCAAAIALGEIGDIEAVDLLIPMLDCENESARCAAVIALGNIGDIRSIQALSKACQDPIDSVRDAAKKSFEKIKRR